MARILIIDDDKSFREALVRDFGHDVVEASGAWELMAVSAYFSIVLEKNRPESRPRLNPDEYY
jgi:hypothetical protein